MNQSIPHIVRISKLQHNSDERLTGSDKKYTKINEKCSFWFILLILDSINLYLDDANKIKNKTGMSASMYSQNRQYIYV
jgi:hypothetical protein